jgi:hypothetical protein
MLTNNSLGPGSPKAPSESHSVDAFDVIGNGSFGLSTATQTSERQIQFGARLMF